MRHPVETVHMQATTRFGGWVPYMSSCGIAPITMTRLTAEPQFVTCRRCKQTKQVRRLTIVITLPEGDNE